MLPKVIHQHKVRLALIDARVEDGLTVGGDRITAAASPTGISEAEYDGALLSGVIVEGDHQRIRALLEFSVIHALPGGLHGGGPPPRNMFGIESLLIVAAGGGNAPEAAVRSQVEVLSIGRFDGLVGAVLGRQGLRIASGRSGLPDLAARLEVDPFAIVRKGGVSGIEQDAGRLIPGRGGEGEDLLAVIAGGVEEERFAVGRPAQAADALVLELGDLHAIAARGIADVDLVAAGWIADVGDPRTVGRPHGVDLAPGGAEERTLFDGIAGAQRGEPDGRRRGTVGVSQAIASNGRIVGLVARDGES